VTKGHGATDVFGLERLNIHNTMKHSLYWQADSRSVNQEIPAFYETQGLIAAFSKSATFPYPEPD
jgi:hypothetical protein